MSRQTRLDWFSSRAEAARSNQGAGGSDRRRRPLRFEPLEDRRLLTIVVNTLVDENDGVGVGGISLRDAIAAAAPNEFINFAPELTASGPATISLTHGELVINKPLAISGPGANLLTIDASGSDPTPSHNHGDGHRVFRIDNGNTSLAVVSISLVTISGGDTLGDGGGIENHENLSVSDTVISGNAADDGGGLYNTSGYATLTRVTLRNNAALDDGGAIANSFGRVTIQDSSLIANMAGDDGGGVFNASDMGGLHNLTIRNSTLTGNTAAGWGGGVFNFSGIATMEFSTIARNASVAGTAGGVGSWGDTNTTRTDVRSSIIAGNSGSDVDHLTGAPGPANSFNSLKYNLIGLGTSLGKFTETGDQVGVADPRLGPLGDYGGPTPTLPLLLNSPAIDAGDPLAFAGFGGVPTNDQRGLSRVADGNGDATSRIDIGAFENAVRYFQVDTAVDENDGNYAIGDLTLREAIHLSNLLATVDTIFFHPNLSGQTITLSQGELTINDSVTIDASALAGGIAIDASGNDSTPGVEDGQGSRVLVLKDDATYVNTITLRSLTLTGADGNGSGGAIYNNDNTTVEGCTITGNSSQWGAGIYNTPYGSLAVVRSTISGNSAISPIPEAIGSGGGLYNWGGNLQILDSVVTGNDSVSDAGGIQNVNGGYLTVARSTVSGNSAVNFGGGIRNGDGYIRIESSTISGNSAQKGGGVHVATPNFRYTTIINSTLSGNVAPLGGGGLLNESGKVRFQFSTVTQNVSNDFAGSGVVAAPSPVDSPVSFYHTIVAGNFDPNGPRPAGALDVAVAGPVNSLTSLGYNLIGTGGFIDETFIEAGDLIIGTDDPGLGPLADNGGPTKTHALLVGSPAIDAGDPSVVAGGEGGGPTTDQRGLGYDRIRDGDADEVVVIDIGAFEVQQFHQAPALPGDYNGNHTVDAADYTLWRDTLGREVDVYSGADGDGDGTIDQDDYGVWKAHFGQGMTNATAGGGSAASAATAEAIEPDVSAAPQAVPQPTRGSWLPGRPGLIRTATPRHQGLRSLSTSISTDQVLASWSARRRIAIARDAASATTESANKTTCDDAQDDIASLDLAFAGLDG